MGTAPHYRALARQMHGRISITRNRRDEARSAYEDAIATFASIGSRLELSRTLYHRGLLSTVEGNAEAARSDAKRALDEFAAMRATRDGKLAAAIVQ